IPFNGPVLAFQAYGDLGLGMFGDPRILIRDLDLARTMATLGGLGYERNKQLTAAQLDLIHRLQGHERLLKKGRGVAIRLYTRLTPINMALDIDYAGLWRRARGTAFRGRAITTLSAEDDLLVWRSTMATTCGSASKGRAVSRLSLGRIRTSTGPPSSIVPDRKDAFAWSCWQPHWHGSISERPYPMRLLPRSATTLR
ncbi:MAG TPA: nucleotidyltransferase family protein, partial [Methylocella sp.]